MDDERDMTTSARPGTTETRISHAAWDDLPIEQKLERLREVVKAQERTIRYLNDRLTHDVERLKEHGHDAIGQIVVPLESRRGYGMAEGKVDRVTESGKPWF